VGEDQAVVNKNSGGTIHPEQAAGAEKCEQGCSSHHLWRGLWSLSPELLPTAVGHDNKPLHKDCLTHTKQSHAGGCWAENRQLLPQWNLRDPRLTTRT
jgi:hypothetical protein